MYTKHKFESDKHFNFNYIKYLPKDYDETKEYPLVFFLHGAGERGDDLDYIARYGYFKFIKEDNKEYPFIAIAPQCPQNKYWGCYTESLLAFLDYILETLPIDKKRVYLTGLSMGGTGSYMLAMADPSKFAALFAVCGSGIYWYACALKNIPTYAYHGDNDTTVPIYESINMVKAINKWGGNAKIKIAYNYDHDINDLAYKDEEIYNWLLAQHK